jgi:hypothetical protein
MGKRMEHDQEKDLYCGVLATGETVVAKGVEFRRCLDAYRYTFPCAVYWPESWRSEAESGKNPFVWVMPGS